MTILARQLKGLLAFALVAGPASAQGLDIFLPENATYRYVNATPGTTIPTVPADWFLPGFDDSGWFVGDGAFGSGFGANLANASGPDTPDADQFPGSTPWSTNFDPYLRTSFELPESMDLTLWIAVDNGVESIYLNGILTGVSFNARGAAFRWEHVVDIPSSFVQRGTNHIALQIEDHGGATAFAMVITEDDSADNPTFSNEPGDAFCFGIGCPCMNDDPDAGCANSTSSGGLLHAAGSESVTSDDLVLIVDQLPANTFGIVYGGPDVVNVPFGDGLRCVQPGPPATSTGGGFSRFPVHNSGAAGRITEGPGLAAFSAAEFLQPITPGSTWRFQGYYRDLQGPCGEEFNLTNGLTILFR